MAVLIGCIGCSSGSQLGEVTGTVTLDGQPAGGLEVNFEPKDINLGTTATGYTQADGTYQLFYPGGKQGAPVGDYTVRISAAEMDEPSGPPVQIPEKYNSQSELTETVKPGSNTINFKLTTGP